MNLNPAPRILWVSRYQRLDASVDVLLSQMRWIEVFPAFGQRFQPMPSAPRRAQPPQSLSPCVLRCPDTGLR